MKTMEEAIKAYLDEFAKNDSEFAAKYANPDKSIAECCKYIYNQVAEMMRNGKVKSSKTPQGNCVGFEDEEVYGMAVHYYDEADIEIKDPDIKCETAVVEDKPAPKAKKKSQPKRKIEVKDDEIEIPELDIPDFGFPIF